MPEIAGLILFIAATVIIGRTILWLLLYREARPLIEELALSYGLGMGGVALQFVLFYSFNLRPSFINMLLPWSILFVIFCFQRRPIASGCRLSALKDISPFEVFLLLGISFEVAVSFFRALIKPIESYDSVAIYAVRAKAFFEAGAVPMNFFTDITKAFPNSGHPLMVPLNEFWLSKFLGSFDDFLLKIIFPLYLAAILVIIYFALREFLKRREALLFTFMLATIPQFNRFSSIGYADFILAFFFTAAFLYLFYWMRKANIRYLAASAAFTGLACWTKMEGWAVFLTLSIILFIFTLINSKKSAGGYFKLGLFLLIVLLIGLPWVYLIKSAGLENEAYKLGSFGPGRFVESIFNLDRCPRIIYEFQKQFIGPKKWNIVWIIFLCLFFLNLKVIFKGEMRYATLLLILIMCGYAYSYLLMPLRPGEPINIYISTNLSRLFIHFTPLGVYWIALLCRERGYLG